MKGTIYLICDPLTETFKIGVTKRDVNARLKEIQTGNPGEIFISKTFESRYPYKLESMLHRKYKSKQTINEWFALDAEDYQSFDETCRKYEEILHGLENPEWI